MKKKIFITLMLLFVANFCFAESPLIDHEGIMSKKEFNDYVIKIREDLKELERTTGEKAVFSILDDSYEFTKYEKNYVINAILNKYDVETGEVYRVIYSSLFPMGFGCYIVRIDKVHKSGKVDFTIKAIYSF